MIKKLWYNFYSGGLNKDKYPFEMVYQVRTINLYSLVGIIMLSLSAVFNYLNDNYVIIWVEFTLAIVLLINLIYLRMSQKYKIASTVILLNSVILISFFFITGGMSVNKTEVLWVFYYPIIAFFLKQKKEGLFWIILLLFISSIVIIISQLNVITIMYSLSAIQQVFFIFLTISVFAYIYEDRRGKCEQMIKKQIYTDSLTQLANRVMFLNDLEKIRSPQLLLINIDSFKEINNFYGHVIGDNMLLLLAEKLRTLLPEKNFKIYKLHADEYSVIPKIKMNKEKLKELAVFLSISISYKFFKIKGNEISINITIGVATGKNNILENADVALKFAKVKRKNYLFYDQSMRLFQEYENNLKWIKRLKNSITENKIIPYFQPIINAKNNKIEKYECLARLIGPKEKIILPHVFIEIAKKAKLCTYITRIMIKKSIEVFKDKNLMFSINITAEDMLNKYTIAYIKKLLLKYSVSNQVIFEILESESIENYTGVSRFITQMKELGCKIAIDDFGIGYSNFQHLLKLKIDYLKIDASLIMNIHKDKNSQAIVESIVTFTKKLNIKTVAEFVFSKAVYTKLKQLKVDYLQGYYLGHPKPTLKKNLH